MAISHTIKYDVATDSTADLALSNELDAALDAALTGDDRHEIAEKINIAINARLAEHGVDTETGEWLGDWSATEIVKAVLDQQTETLHTRLAVYRQARASLHDDIREAHALGATPTELAEWSGLSRQGIYKILGRDLGDTDTDDSREG